MKVHLAKTAGFCFGVKRALDIARKAADGSAPVEMLGDIVHNEDVVREIRKKGIKKVKRLTKGKNKTLLIRAHGVSQKIMKEATEKGYTIIDATCPMVKEIHKIARDCDQKGLQVIIIGDKNHDEVRGIRGQLNHRPLVLDIESSVPCKEIRKMDNVAVVVQSTQNTEKVQKAISKIRACVKNLKFFNTICRPTRQKQQKIKTMPLENDVMIIIGSKSSANTKRLYQISKALNKKSYWIQSQKDINPRWFTKAQTVGVTAGASTPDKTTQSVVNYLKKL